jgi:hypothetical protein
MWAVALSRVSRSGPLRDTARLATRAASGMSDRDNGCDRRVALRWASRRVHIWR